MNRTRSGATPPTYAYIAANTAMLWLTVAIASVALWPIYRSGQMLVMVMVAVVAGSLIAVAGARFRWPAPVVLLATVLAFAALGVAVAVPDDALYGVLPTVDGLLALVSGVTVGWKQLLTISLPVGSYESLLVPFFALILVVTVCSLSAALRSPRGGLAAIGPAIIYLAAIAFGPAVTFWPVAASLGLLAAILIWLALRRAYARRAAVRIALAQSGMSDDRRTFSWRTVASGALILVLAGGVGVVATSVLPPVGERQVLRTSVEQPFDPRQFPSPLSAFRTYWQQPTADSVLLSVEGLPEGALLRIATLDSYDGVVYAVGSELVDSASGSFTRVPYEFDQSGIAGEQVELDVEIQAYSNVWVPTIGQFESLEFEGTDAAALRNSFYYNNTSGTAAVLDGLSTGDRYSLSAVVPTQPGADQIRTLEAGAAEVPELVTLPPELSLALDGYVEGLDSQGERLAAMIDGLQDSGYISHGVAEDEPASRSGHAVDRISQLLTDQRMIGDAEQYAVTAALMARELGYPARVVLGFAPETSGGATEIRGSDISAWIEVDTAEYGWVSIDPNPALRDIPIEEPLDPSPIARPQTVIPPPAVESDPVDRQSATDVEQDDSPVPDPLLQLILTIVLAASWTIVGIAIALSPFLLVIAAKARRRRLRRKARSNLDRIRGGWKEFEDSVVDHGIVLPPASTRSEIATIVGGPQPIVLAAVADRAVFAPMDADDADADSVWRSVTDLRASLNEGKSWWQRVRARISLRSLGGYSGKNPTKR